jgi:hypothetical protein
VIAKSNATNRILFLMHRHKNKDIKNLMSSYFNVNIYIAFIEINHIGFKDEIFENRQILEDANSMQMKNIYIFVASKGGLAQLARAFDWQSLYSQYQ